MISDLIDVTASDHCQDLAAAKAAILAACVRYNQVGKLSRSTVVEVRFSRSDGLVEIVDVSKSNELVAGPVQDEPPLTFDAKVYGPMQNRHVVQHEIDLGDTYGDKPIHPCKW